MRLTRGRRRDDAYLVTEAQRSRSEDISHRERRYLAMMAIRVICFVLAVLMYTHGAGWLTAIPAVGAIAIPYFAVVLANAGREPDRTRRFRPYEPRLPATRPGPAAGANGASAPGDGHDDIGGSPSSGTSG